MKTNNSNAVCIWCWTTKVNNENNFCINWHDRWLKMEDGIQRWYMAANALWVTIKELKDAIINNHDIKPVTIWDDMEKVAKMEKAEKEGTIKLK